MFYLPNNQTFILDNVSRHCSVDALWADKTDYSQCRPLELEMNLNITQETSELPPDLEISIVIYLIGIILFYLQTAINQIIKFHFTLRVETTTFL